MPETMDLKVVHGDATNPQTKGKKMIVHVCNDVGAWGAGFVLAISRRWSQPEADYLWWYRLRHEEYQPYGTSRFRLGEVQYVNVTKDIVVCNMVAQSGIFTGVPPIRYDALRLCLEKVAKSAKAWRASVHMPRIGCGLAGGTWEEVGPIVQETLVDQGIDTTVYDYP